LEYLYPYLSESISNAMKTKKDDDVMWSYRPDWWDIGNNFGPRAYMTILFAKALKDFNYISSGVGESPDKLLANDELANRMEKQVVNKFWDGKKKFIMNYLNDGTQDPHYYVGSLMAINYSMLDKKRMDELLQTTKNVLLDKKLGIYTAFPMDFTRYEKILGFSDEVGMPYYYFNGGIWNQDNAWYALALAKNGNKKEALEFIKTTMTLDGIIKGPNGQPAMYEVRIPDKDDPSIYGTVDKPQFMWAGGWYLYTLYHLYGIDENDWNISFNPFISEGQKSCSFSLSASGNILKVRISGKGKYIKSIKYDDKIVSTAVIPKEPTGTKSINIVLGYPESPYVKETGSELINSSFDNLKKKMKIELSSFAGHTTNTIPKQFMLTAIK
jgi:cellobiose phosphorylase